MSESVEAAMTGLMQQGMVIAAVAIVVAVLVGLYTMLATSRRE